MVAKTISCYSNTYCGSNHQTVDFSRIFLEFGIEYQSQVPLSILLVHEQICHKQNEVGSHIKSGFDLNNAISSIYT